MEQRKIMSLGRSSLVVSLPKHWIKMNELKRGDSVSVAVQRDRSLVLFPGKKTIKEEKKITLQVEPNEKRDSITRRVIACYLNGYFGIKLVTKNIFTIAQQQGIRDVAGKLYMRIIESDSKKIYMQTLLDLTMVSIDSSVHRMNAITISMYKDALNSIKTLDKDLAKVVYSLDDDVDKFSLFLLRLLYSVAIDPALANQLGFEPIDCLHYQILVNRIEHIADRATNIARHVLMLEGNQQSILEPIVELLLSTGNEVLDAYVKAVKVFFLKDVHEADKIIELENTIEKLNQKIASQVFAIKDLSPIGYCSICSIRESIRETMDHAVDIAEVTIDRIYKES